MLSNPNSVLIYSVSTSISSFLSDSLSFFLLFLYSLFPVKFHNFLYYSEWVRLDVFVLFYTIIFWSYYDSFLFLCYFFYATLDSLIIICYQVLILVLFINSSFLISFLIPLSLLYYFLFSWKLYLLFQSSVFFISVVSGLCFQFSLHRLRLFFLTCQENSRGGEYFRQYYNFPFFLMFLF